MSAMVSACLLSSLIWQVFSALDVDMTGRIGFAELYLFVMGRANHVTGSVSTGFNAKASRDEVR
jgi:hypothetical protein